MSTNENNSGSNCELCDCCCDGGDNSVKRSDVKNDDSRKVDIKKDGVKKDDVKSHDVKNDDVEDDVNKDDVNKNDVRKDDVKKDAVKRDHVKTKSDDATDDVKKNDVKSDDVKTDEVKKDAVKKDAVQKDAVEKDDVKKNDVKKNDVKKDDVKKDDVKKNAVEKDAVEKDAVEKDDVESDDTDEDDGRPAKPQPNLSRSRRAAAASGQLGKSDEFRRLEAAWPGEFRQRMAVPYSEYDSHSRLGKISWSEYALVEKEETIRKGHHAVCPLIRSRKTGTLYRCKIMSSSRVHFNLTTLGFKAAEFEREIRNCLAERQLLFAFDQRHPFVRAGLGYFTDASCNFGVFLQEFPHGTLLDYYEKSDSNRIVCNFEEAAVRMLAAQVVLALEYLHCIGCVHRDVQASNLLVDRRGYVRLTDFAITAAAEPDALRPLQAVTCFRYYAAPEYFNGKGYGYPVDFYALGLVLYELLTRACFCDQEEVFGPEGQVDWGCCTQLPEEEHRRRLAQQVLDAQAIQGQAQSSSAARLAAAAAPPQPQRPTPPSPEARAFVEDCLLPEPDCRPDRRTARLYGWFAAVDFDRLYAGRLDLPWRPPAGTAVSYQPDVDEEYPLAGAVLDRKPLPAEFEPFRHLF